MISSTYLYGSMDAEMATLQKLLFMKKLAKAVKLRNSLPLNLLDFSDEQREVQLRMKKINKAIEFCKGQIEEAEEVLNDV